MPIDIENPGDELPALRTALSDIVRPWYWSPPDPADFTALSYNATNPTFTDDDDVGPIWSYNGVSC